MYLDHLGRVGHPDSSKKKGSPAVSCVITHFFLVPVMDFCYDVDLHACICRYIANHRTSSCFRSRFNVQIDLGAH
jgi:hypothetical protein